MPFARTARVLRRRRPSCRPRWSPWMDIEGGMKNNFGSRIFPIAVAALLLAGCASGAAATKMTVAPSEIVKPTNTALIKAINVTEVGGGSETNAAWMSRVGTPEFKAALIESLRLAGMLAEGQGRYNLKAELLALDQPMIGLDMTVTAVVHYVLTDASTGAIVWQDAVKTPYTASMGDAFIGSKRLQIANEGAARKNIAALIERLGAAQLSGVVALTVR
jgi:hypothetical protein